MGWQKREGSTNLVILGDAEGNARKAAGLLAAVTTDRRYPDNKRYELVQQDGSSISLAGSTAINSQLGPDDVGRFVKITFTGWEKGRNGRYKTFEIEVYEGEPTADMLKWPRYAELNEPRNSSPSRAPASPIMTPESVDEDDDLPF